MPHYVDDFVLPVPESRIDDYLEIAREAGEVWREHGALEFSECVADDVKVGELTSFPRSAQVRTARRSCSPGSSSNRASTATASTRR